MLLWGAEVNLGERNIYHVDVCEMLPSRIMWRYHVPGVPVCVDIFGAIQQAEILISQAVGDFRVNPRFHPTSVGRNLGLTREFSAPIM